MVIDNMSSKKITLEKIIGDESQIKILYELLKSSTYIKKTTPTRSSREVYR